MTHIYKSDLADKQPFTFGIDTIVYRFTKMHKETLDAKWIRKTERRVLTPGGSITFGH